MSKEKANSFIQEPNCYVSYVSVDPIKLNYFIKKVSVNSVCVQLIRSWYTCDVKVGKCLFLTDILWWCQNVPVTFQLKQTNNSYNYAVRPHYILLKSQLVNLLYVYIYTIIVCYCAESNKSSTDELCIGRTERPNNVRVCVFSHMTDLEISLKTPTSPY